MAAMSDYLENKLLDHVLRNTTFASPAAVHAGLFSTDPTDAGTGTEVAAARQTVAFDAPAGTTGACANSADLNWASMPAGAVTHIGIFDAATGGNLLLHGPLAASKTVNAGDTLTIYAGDLVITLA